MFVRLRERRDEAASSLGTLEDNHQNNATGLFQYMPGDWHDFHRNLDIDDDSDQIPNTPGEALDLINGSARLRGRGRSRRYGRYAILGG